LTATITRTDIIQAISEKIDCSSSKASTLLEDFIEITTQDLHENGNTKIANFGSFTVHHKQDRLARNPKTKEPAIVTSRKTVAFKASDTLKKCVNGRG
jgi:integration host factor subunit alpha